MDIENRIWVQLKSNANEVFYVRGQSASKEILDCLSPQCVRKYINTNDIEIIIDEERLLDLDNQKVFSF